MPTRVFQNNFTTGAVSPAMACRIDLSKYRSGCKQVLNALVHAHGGISYRPGTKYVDRVTGNGVLYPFQYSDSDSYILCFLEGKVRVYLNGAVVLDKGVAFEFTSPYALAEAGELGFLQSADTLFVVHRNHPPRTLTRTGHTLWSWEVLQFTPSIVAPATPTVTAVSFGSGTKNQTIEYKISAVSAQEEESYPSGAGSVKIPKTWVEGATVKLTWAESAGAANYNVYKNRRGFYGWIGTVAAADAISGQMEFIDDNIEPDAGAGPKEAKNPFADGNNPGAAGIFHQRLIFAGSNSQPQTVWASQPGSFRNFSTSYPLKDDDSIEATLDSRQMNAIRHLLTLKKEMVILTGGAEWTMGAGAAGDAIAPTRTYFFNQSYHGSSRVPPLTVGNSILMLQASGRIVRDLYYTVTEEYTGTEVSILAEHLLQRPITGWAYQNEPYHTVYAIRSDGVLLTLTYMREQEVFAWAEHRTQGFYRSVAVIREGNLDRVYFLIERAGNFFVERQEMREYGEPVEEAFFVDCGATYRGSATRTVSGLDYLAGKEVAILADGSVSPPQTVTAEGKITLPEAASVVHVGLGYMMRIETLDPELSASEGSSIGLKKKVSRVAFRIREGRGVSVGQSRGSLNRVKFNPPEKYGDPPVLATGDFDVPISSASNTEASVVIEHKEPLPLTILGVVTQVD